MHASALLLAALFLAVATAHPQAARPTTVSAVAAPGAAVTPAPAPGAPGAAPRRTPICKEYDSDDNEPEDASDDEDERYCRTWRAQRRAAAATNGAVVAPTTSRSGASAASTPAPAGSGSGSTSTGTGSTTGAARVISSAPASAMVSPLMAVMGATIALMYSVAM
ncbi:hypothetical protein H9P43_004293 [Blastocladiella emersonii ATCC 22665]|nr:hypothetical protein H9P43_004293 [Blastocladiella emersonii ATCC 22665]